MESRIVAVNACEVRAVPACCLQSQTLAVLGDRGVSFFVCKFDPVLLTYARE